MKIALYIEDGLEQVVLTPESDTEKAILGKLSDGTRSLSVRHGSFYECRGGWMRYSQSYDGEFGPAGGRDSTMLVLRPVATDESGKPDHV